MTTPEVVQLDPLADLQLDPFNPRLRRDEEGVSQDKLIEIMIKRFKVEDVADSIVRAGWVPHDPLLAVREDDQVRVVEGNRRLTAVKLLLSPELAPEQVRQRWQALAASIDDTLRSALSRLTVQIYPDRDDPEVASYIGFRHVTGVLPWPAQEKASYIARMAKGGMSYAELADRLGSRPLHMKRHHVAFQMVEQAIEWELDGAQQLGDAFGVLLRSLQTEGIPAFLHINYGDEPDQNLRPVPDDHRDAFQDFIRWGFGTANSARLLPESRALTQFGRILQSEPATRYLRVAREPRFDKAWSMSGGEADSLADMLWQASYAIQDAVPLFEAHLDEASVLQAARECARYMRQIESLLAQAQETPRA